MTKFCPYCGNQLGTRSKFCAQCGRAKPERQGGAVGVDVAVDPARNRPSGNLAPDSGFQRKFERAAQIERQPGTRVEGSRTVSMGSRPNGAAHAASRRYAPPTYAQIDKWEQAGFGLRYGAWMFDFLITLIAIMGFTFAVTFSCRLKRGFVDRWRTHRAFARSQFCGAGRNRRSDRRHANTRHLHRAG